MSIIDDLREKNGGKRCEGTGQVLPMKNDGDPRLPGAWTPMPQDRRIEIVIAGNPSSIQEVGDAVMTIQSELLNRRAVDGTLKLCLTSFLDNCIHSTGYRDSILDVRNASTRWHCYQTDTRFYEALSTTLNQPYLVDAIIIVGNGFDDNLRKVEAVARQLRQKGTRIFALSTRRGAKDSFEKIAVAGGGVSLDIENCTGEDLGKLMTAVAEHVFRRGDLIATDDPALAASRKGDSPLVQTWRKQLLLLPKLDGG